MQLLKFIRFRPMIEYFKDKKASDLQEREIYKNVGVYSYSRDVSAMLLLL